MNVVHGGGKTCIFEKRGRLINMRLVNKLKPGVPKRVLFFAAAFVWGFAGNRIINIGFSEIMKNSNEYWINISAALAGFYFFFKYVFYKMFKKHTKRIVNSEIEKPCIFSFFDIKGFAIMAFMITFGVTIRKLGVIPPLYMGTFYITLGLSLLAAAVSFLYAGIRYKLISIKYLA